MKEIHLITLEKIFTYNMLTQFSSCLFEKIFVIDKSGRNHIPYYQNEIWFWFVDKLQTLENNWIQGDRIKNVNEFMNKHVKYSKLYTRLCFVGFFFFGLCSWLINVLLLLCSKSPHPTLVCVCVDLWQHCSLLAHVKIFLLPILLLFPFLPMNNSTLCNKLFNPLLPYIIMH